MPAKVTNKRIVVAHVAKISASSCQHSDKNIPSESTNTQHPATSCNFVIVVGNEVIRSASPGNVEITRRLLQRRVLHIVRASRWQGRRQRAIDRQIAGE